MNTNDSQSDEYSRDQNRSDAGEEHYNYGGHDEHAKGFAIGECAAEEDQGLIGGAEKVKEEPGTKEAEEGDERERVREKRERKHGGDHGYVVDAEVGEVLADAGRGVGERVGADEGAPVDELQPRAAVGEAAADGGGEACDERAEGGGANRLRGLAGDSGLVAGDWEGRW